mmetsp:Transcript_10395/g.33011  ORF Transcript_10395/g.33011 Transcript_10395/m.33011 type:complete len:284 (-) Transcript_10395:484-1335(-)
MAPSSSSMPAQPSISPSGAYELPDTSCVRRLLAVSPMQKKRFTTISFVVSVPVLSEQMQLVLPSVSTPSRFFTSTDFLAMLLAVRASPTVTVASRPSGTLATMMPIMNTRLVMKSVPMEMPTMKKDTPSTMATADTILTKWWISRAIGVSSAPVTVVRRAMRPMTVLSPTPTTTAVHDPRGTSVPKNARFLVSRGFSSVHSGERFTGSDSPVSDELSTCMSSEHSSTRTSAGTLLPALRCTMSPRTSCTALISVGCPSRTTVVSDGIMFLNDSISCEDLRFWE